MAEIQDLAVTAAGNTARFPEGMQFRNVNDSARELEAMIAREYRDRNGSLQASGSGGAFTLTTNRTITAFADAIELAFTANHSITGPATLNINGIGSKPIVAQDGSALGSGDIVSGQKVSVVSRSSTNDYQLVGGRVAGSSADVLARIIDVGFISAWPLSTVPSGWLECNGAAVSRTTYQALFAKIGTSYGSGDGSTTFNLPNYTDQFLRGYSASGIDAASRTNRGDGTTGASVGTRQSWQTYAHQHSWAGSLVSGSAAGVGDHYHQFAYGQSTAQSGSGVNVVTGFGSGTAANTTLAGAHSHGVTGTVGDLTGSSGGSETRPQNVTVKFIILANPAAASASNIGGNCMLYRRSSGTTDTDPGTGKLALNHATLASATQLYIS